MWHPRSIKRLLGDEEIRDMYTAIDPRTLRAGCFSQQWRPRGAPLAEQMPLEGERSQVSKARSFIRAR
eukprot:6891352-Pyramimonas_sp.AAC.1